MNKGYIYSKNHIFFGNKQILGYGEDFFYVKIIKRDLANEIIKKNHYSHKFYTASYIHLGVFINKSLFGVLQFGYAMNPASAKSVVKETGINEYLELNRMWLDDKAEKNSESKAISYCIHFIKGAYPKIKWIQSFADERCGKFGIVYQAANFDYYGEHDSIFWEVEGEVFHNSLMTRNPNLTKSAKYLQENKEKAISYKLRQFRYLYFIDKRKKKDCLLEKKVYPKHYKEGDL